jgi:hypothetical protein
MKSIKLSKELLSMLIIVILLTGFSYAVQPGRQPVTEETLESVSLDYHTQGGNHQNNNYKDAATIRSAVEVLNNMKEVPRENNSSYRENRNFTIRFNFKNGFSRTYFVHYFINGSTVYLNPFNTGVSYEVPKSLIDSLLQNSAPSNTTAK